MFTRYPLRLRFIEGEDGGGSDSAVDSAPIENDSAEPQAPSGGSNPAWADIESQVDPFTFSKLQPVLLKMDQAAQQRITQSNKQLEPYKQFIDNGVLPEQLQGAMSLAQQLNDNPVEVYQRLGAFLEENGRMPTAQEQANTDPVTGEIPNEEDDDPRFQKLEALQQQADQMQEYLAQQQYQQELHAATVELDNEVSTLKSAHAELTEDDVKEIIRQTAFVAQQNSNGKIPSLEETYTSWFTGFRNRILSTPRPGDSAPRLLPTNGGLPSGQSQQSLGQLSRSELQAFIANSLEQDNRSGR